MVPWRVYENWLFTRGQSEMGGSGFFRAITCISRKARNGRPYQYRDTLIAGVSYGFGGIILTAGGYFISGAYVRYEFFS